MSHERTTVIVGVQLYSSAVRDDARTVMSLHLNEEMCRPERALSDLEGGR